jgi:hypothetical protein
MVSSISENPTNHRRIGKRVAKTVFVEGMMRALAVAAGPLTKSDGAALRSPRPFGMSRYLISRPRQISKYSRLGRDLSL